MKGTMNPLWSLVVLVIAAFAWTIALAPVFGFGGSIVTAFLFVAALALIGQALGAVKLFPIKGMYAGILGVVVLLFFFGGVIGGIFTTAVSGLHDVSAEVQGQTPIQPQQQSVSDSCAASVAPTARDLTATLTINGYDYANSNPLGNNVNANISIFRAASLAEANANNFVKTAADTTDGSVSSGLKVGDTVSIFGNGGVDYYVLPTYNVCLDGQQKSVNVKAYAIASESGITSTVYDSSGTALSAGNGGTDFTTAMGADEKAQFRWDLKENTAAKSYYLGALGFAMGTNITDAYPTGSSAALFKSAVTIPSMRDISVAYNSTATNSVTKTYSVYELKEPELLTEFEIYRTDFLVKASSNDPVGAPGTTTASEVFGLAKDATWVINPATGAPDLRIDDGSSSGADVGMAETETSPCGKQTGFCLEVT